MPSSSHFLIFHGDNKLLNYYLVQDSHTENTPSNKTQALTKSTNMDIWLIGTLTQLFIRGFYTRIKGKTLFFAIFHSVFLILFALILVLGKAVLYGNVAFSTLH